MQSLAEGAVGYHLECINPAHVELVWPYVEPLIRAAVEKTRLSDFGVVRHDLFNGGALLWIAWHGYIVKAAAVTQVTVANGDKYCTITACGGHDSEEWIRLIAGLEAYAKREGCRAMRIFGRKGWKYMLPDYKVKGFVLERPL